ncbi:unnamed protein product, partial [Rotaria sordida]
MNITINGKSESSAHCK